MVNVGCIFCHSEIDSDSMEDINTRYERHLTDWHRISDEGERKLAMTRTMLKLVENNNNTSESRNDNGNNNDETLSSKIDKAMKVGNDNKNQITFENDDFVVSASFPGDFSQEEISSNPDATSVEGCGFDFDDNGGTYLLDARNIELEQEFSTLQIDKTNLSKSYCENENASQSILVTGDMRNTDMNNDNLLPKDINVHKDISAAIDLGPVIGENNETVDRNIFKPTVEDGRQKVRGEECTVDVNDDKHEAENDPDANIPLNKDVPRDVLLNPFYSDSSSNASDQLNADEGIDTEILGFENVPCEFGGKDSLEFTNCQEEKEHRSKFSPGGKVVRKSFVEVSKLSENEVVNKIAVDEIQVPWYEWGSHTCVVCSRCIFLGSVERHLQQHKLSIEEYLVEHHIQEIKLFIPPYKCLVCDKPVPHSNKAISAHIKVHGLDMASYYFKYVSDDAKPEVMEFTNDKEESVICDVAQRDISTNSCRKTGTKRRSVIESAHTKRPRSRSGSSTESDTLPWYEGGWHRCMECGDVFTKGRFFVSHVRVGHKMSRKEYMEKFPEDDVTIDDWKCEMCGRGVSWCVRSIAAHLAKAHSISKEQYASRYIEKHRNNPEEIKESNAKIGNQQTSSKETAEGGTGSSQDLLVVFDKYS